MSARRSQARFKGSSMSSPYRGWMAHGHGHGHRHRRGWWARLRHAVTPHSHDSGDVTDSALETSRRGMRTLWISFGALLVTAVGQAVLVAVTGSVALLGDTLHNV